MATTPAAPTYDADGNMLFDGTYTYQWDSQSRLTKINWGAGSNKTTEYKYNALGQRSQVIETAPGYSPNYTFYLYDGIHLLDRRTGNSSPNSATIDRRYFSQGEQRLSTINNQPSTINYFYTRDHLGSIREVVKSDGTLAARYDYDPYGKRSTRYLASTYPGGCDLGFTGHITLAPGTTSTQPEIVLTYFRAYSPELGRWLSRDPIGEEGGLNLYAYCYGNPLNFYDPDGMFGIPTFTQNGFGLPGSSWTPKQHEEYQAIDREAGKMAAQNLACAAVGGGAGALLGRLPMAAVAIGPGAGKAGIHVSFGAGGQWLHVMSNRITAHGAKLAAEIAYNSYKIPVISTAAVLASKGSKASNCVTGAASAIARGWTAPIGDALKKLWPF